MGDEVGDWINTDKGVRQASMLPPNLLPQYTPVVMDELSENEGVGVEEKMLTAYGTQIKIGQRREAANIDAEADAGMQQRETATYSSCSDRSCVPARWCSGSASGLLKVNLAPNIIT